MVIRPTHHLSAIRQSLHQDSIRVTLGPGHLVLQSTHPTLLVRGLTLELPLEVLCLERHLTKEKTSAGAVFYT